MLYCKCYTVTGYPIACTVQDNLASTNIIHLLYFYLCLQNRGDFLKPFNLSSPMGVIWSCKLLYGRKVW